MDALFDFPPLPGADDTFAVPRTATAAPADAARRFEAAHGFTPVPVRPRADGWTPAKQARFIRWLADVGDVGEAAAKVGMSRRGANALRRRAGAEHFADAWDIALVSAGEALLDRMVRRAVDGLDAPVIRAGRIVGAHRVHDTLMLMALIERSEGRARRLHRRKIFGTKKGRAQSARMGS